MSDLSDEDSNEEDSAVAVPTHEFSSPWDDSDLVLIVEEQKLHVHSIILKMASPVFKTMLSSDDFKEKKENELSLPGKKADNFVDFLRQIYPDLISQQIKMDNVEHIYKMAHEYQIERIKKACRNFLKSAITTYNVDKVLALAQDMDSSDLREQCYNTMVTMTAKSLKHINMDEQSLRNVLLPKIERLEGCLRKIRPQIVGLMDCLMHVWRDASDDGILKNKPSKCSKHTHSNRPRPERMAVRLKCEICRHSFIDMAVKSRIEGKRRDERWYNENGHKSECFDEDIVSVLQEMCDMLDDTRYFY